MSDEQVKVTDNSEEVKRELQDALTRAFEMIGLQMESRAKEYITEFGAVDTGNLRDSITHESGQDGSDYYAAVGTNVEYGQYVEFGMGSNASYGERPFIRSAAENHMDEYRDMIESELRK